METIKRIIPIILLLLFGQIQGCKKGSNQEKIDNEIGVARITNSATLNKLNISVLIDLSDRIDPKKNPSVAMEYYLRDVGYLESVAKTFETHLLNKKVRLIDDKIQIFIDPEPADQSINKKIGELKLQFTNENVIKDSILNVTKKYSIISSLIYQSAIEDNNFVGSDIWGFFKSKVQDYCIDNEYRNIMIILTDGYMYHVNAIMKQENRTSYLLPNLIKSNNFNNPNWQNKLKEKDFGFIVPNQDLSDLEILVMGINPSKGNPYEEEVIRAYWSKWFDEMKVKKYEIKQADLPVHMEKIIQDFILYK